MAKPGQRVEETIAVRDSHDLPDADELAEEIALVGTAAVALLLPLAHRFLPRLAGPENG